MLNNRQTGLVTIYMVVVMGAIFLGMSMTATNYSLSAISLSRYVYQSNQLKYLGESCLELALLAIYDNPYRPEDGTNEIQGVGNCEYRIKVDGQDFTATVESELSKFDRSLVQTAIISIVRRKLVIKSLE